VQFLQGSWTQPLTDHAPFDMVVSNPPYVTDVELGELAADVQNYEPHTALAAGADGMDAYRSIVPGLPPLLQPDAYVAMEVDPRRAAQVEALLREHLSTATTRRIHDLTDRDRVVEAVTAA